MCKKHSELYRRIKIDRIFIRKPSFRAERCIEEATVGSNYRDCLIHCVYNWLNSGLVIFINETCDIHWPEGGIFSFHSRRWANVVRLDGSFRPAILPHGSPQLQTPFSSMIKLP